MIPSIIVGLVVIAIVGSAVWKLVRNKKSGKTSCGCGGSCEGCKLCCPSKNEKK